MLIDQIISIDSTEQPKETTIRYAPIDKLRTLIQRIELAYSNSEDGKVLLAKLCDDITLLVPVEKKGPTLVGIDSFNKET